MQTYYYKEAPARFEYFRLTENLEDWQNIPSTQKVQNCFLKIRFRFLFFLLQKQIGKWNLHDFSSDNFFKHSIFSGTSISYYGELGRCYEKNNYRDNRDYGDYKNYKDRNRALQDL